MSSVLDLLGSNPTNERLELVTRLLEAEAAAKKNDIRLKELELSLEQTKGIQAPPSALDGAQNSSLPSLAGPLVDEMAQDFNNLGFTPTTTELGTAPVFDSLPTTSELETCLLGSISDSLWSAPFDSSMFEHPSFGPSTGQCEIEADGLDFSLFGADNSLGFLDELLLSLPKPFQNDFDYTYPPTEVFQSRGTPTAASSPSLVSSPPPSTPSTSCSSPFQSSQAPTSPKLIAVPYRNLAGRAKKRHVPQYEVRCRACHKSLGIAHLYTEPDEAAEFTSNFACKQCEHGNAWDDAKMAKLIFSKKRYMMFEPHEAPVRCDVCKNAVCAGGFRKSGVQEWVAPGFAVEFNCASCVSRFSLCTDCGAGGRYRTGKWRPKELFAPGRATCSLSHIRIAAVKTRSAVWHLPHDAPPFPGAPQTDLVPIPSRAIQEGVRECAMAVSLNALGRPLIMQVDSENFGTFEKVRRKSEAFACAGLKELSGTGLRTMLKRATRSYVGMRTIVANEKSDDVYRDWQLAEDGKAAPRVTGIGMVEWDLQKGLIYCTFGTGTSLVKVAGTTPFMEILERIVEDYEAMISDPAAAIHGLVRPKFYFCRTSGFADTPEKDVWTMRGYRTIVAKNNVWGFLDGEADDEEAAILSEIMSLDGWSDRERSRATPRLGRVDRLLETHRQFSATEQNPTNSKKRQLK
ncbi:hypothetical protein HDU87_005893 [Geranomyces variabilis]|uniref:Uncharacterized protein n=1 Tax=Geranomyces variabilis TaxID=109894 RepID=A0AAD5TQ04_9FUNG|nr:hypothetical protein HDU87_005893 [Geranomyces variabilis]